MITVYADITAPLYWWKEFDTYKVGTVANSCSTMHKIHAKEFSLDDFSHKHLDIRTIKVLEGIVKILNDYRNWYVNYGADELEIKGCPSQKLIWWQMIRLLPFSYNRKRTVMLNYEVLSNIHQHRHNHKLDEWRDFCCWIEDLPYSDEMVRKNRRTAKETKETLLAVVEWAEKHKDAIKSLERLLGDVRKTEHRIQNWIYSPRTEIMKEEVNG